MRHSAVEMEFLHAFALALCCALGVWLRLEPVRAFGEELIHEYDPWFNYRLVEYAHLNGVLSLFGWKDERVWYPKGRFIGDSAFFGLAFVTLFVYRIVCLFLGNQAWSLVQMCVFIPPLFSIFTCVAVYAFASEVFCSVSAGLYSALLAAVASAHYSRTAAGAYDYECICIFLMVMTLYFWHCACCKNSVALSFVCALFLLAMAFSWGGYVFVLNVICLHSMVLWWAKAELNRRLLLFFHSTVALGCFLIPCIRWKALRSIDHAASNLLLMLLVLGKRLYFLVPLAGITGFVKFSISGRIQMLLKGQTANPISASISEHQPSNWKTFFTDYHIALVLAACGMQNALRSSAKNRESIILLSLWFCSALYFTCRMVRITVLLAPVVCIFAGYTLSRTKKPVLNVFILLFACLHFVKVNKTLYSNPIIVLPSNVKGESIDDFREAYAWMNFNLPVNSRIAAWWDYGYQIAGMTSNMTTFCDNYTVDFEQIGRIAHFFCLREEEAWKLGREMQIEYVMVVFGGVLGFPGDDLGKLHWISLVAKHYYPQSPFQPLSCLMYKLAYHEMYKVLAQAPKVSLVHFEEVFSSENFLVRIYSLKKP